MMEETLGRRIAAHRKRLGLTQDALAERLGVTAQAVSKWENDQSCPDITMLPRLAEIFDSTIDALLGVEKKAETEDPMPVQVQEEVAEVPVVTAPNRRVGIGIALWLLLAGLVLLAVEIRPTYHLAVSISGWKTVCLSGLMVYGLLGVYPRFSLFRLGCSAVGGYYLFVDLFQPSVQLNEELLLPILLLFFGAGLLADTIRGKNPFAGHFSLCGAQRKAFEYAGRWFRCSTCFGSEHRNISLPELDGGEASVCFGELVLDLHDCGSFRSDCRISLECVFGSLTLQVPRSIRLECVNENVFGTVQEIGCPDPGAQTVLRVRNEVVFGAITLKYI